MRQTHRVDELHADLGDAFARQYFQKAHETFENLQERAAACQNHDRF